MLKDFLFFMFSRVFSFMFINRKQDLLKYHTITFLFIFGLLTKPMQHIDYLYHNLSYSYFLTVAFEIMALIVFKKKLHQLSFIFLIKHFLQKLLVLIYLTSLKMHLNANILILHLILIFNEISFVDHGFRNEYFYAENDVLPYEFMNDDVCSLFYLL
jgi:hypothetical protein